MLSNLANIYHPPTKLPEGNIFSRVMFSVMSFLLFTGRGLGIGLVPSVQSLGLTPTLLVQLEPYCTAPLTCSNLLNLDLYVGTFHLQHDQISSLCSPYCRRQVGG